MILTSQCNEKEHCKCPARLGKVRNKCFCFYASRVPPQQPGQKEEAASPGRCGDRHESSGVTRLLMSSHAGHAPLVAMAALSSSLQLR